jgi:hypothetical protein
MRQAVGAVASMAARALPSGREFAYTRNTFITTSGNAHTMTRTPTTSVTAIAILANAAARAFAWNVSIGARPSGSSHGSTMLLPLSLQLR